MTLAEAWKLVKRENWKPLPWLALSLALSGAALPARGECVSPSAAAGATTTTIYRCPEEGSSAGPRPTIVDPGNSTVVERGSADVPWFGPKPTRTADPLTAPKAVSQPSPPEDVAKTEPVPLKTPATAAKPATSGNNATPQIPPATKAPEAAAETPAADKTPEATGKDEATSKAAEAEPADTDVSEPETTSAEPKPLKAKATKTKHAKAKHKKLKLAKSKRAKAKLVEEKRDNSKATKTETEATGKTAKTAKREPKPEPVATEPAKGDDKIILMTKKNMPLGSRIKNWLGL